MFSRFKTHLSNNFPYLLKERFLIAISGGIDSVVLAHLCHKMKMDFGLAHCNFQLRDEESDGDEEFVRGLARELNVPVYVKSFKTREIAGENNSIQLVARQLRYDWFKDLLKQENFNYILTAHHLNDDMETFFINLIRGTGIQGLAGIPVENEKVIRPLLGFSRQEIYDFAIEHKITWREDRSNASDDYIRNRIRHHAIPLFERENPDFADSFKITQTHLRESVALLDNYEKEQWANLSFRKNGYTYFKIDAIKENTHPKALLYLLFKDYGFKNWKDVTGLLTAQSGKMVQSHTHRLLKDRSHLILDKKERSRPPQFYLDEDSEKLDFTDGSLICEKVIKVTDTTNNIAYLASEKLTFPLTLRLWQSGDVFQPFGMKNTKKISDFLRDEKISLFEKEKTWVLVSNETVVWVVGHRINDRFKVEEGVDSILKITYRL